MQAFKTHLTNDVAKCVNTHNIIEHLDDGVFPKKEDAILLTLLLLKNYTVHIPINEDPIIKR